LLRRPQRLMSKVKKAKMFFMVEEFPKK
jgi:hypothetical protein